MSVGQRLKYWRKQKGYTQAQLAEKANMSRSYVADVERDRYNPSVETLSSIAKALNIPVSNLLEDNQRLVSESPEEYRTSKKDEKDIAKRMEQIKKDLKNAEGLSFSGEPMSDEAIESLLEAMEYAVRQTQRINKKYIPKKHRNSDDD
ncbi:helix-turn-helix domain-containing protein [Bacillus licheniformis]|uniref:helix-turn-helix domain-containing protein n=1 Tax=Bacillus TaxID=1386 RepID=UPI00227F922B|nr:MULTISPECIES: helix-turn-helix transcriptional regulator [Bacillus]MCY8401484.1 helix-turn-helix domain-containing protein [Bacillus haynesii]MCY9158549.1 helix-turn-helix domain-containing protein [Bacillus haynesii]MCY9352585.1 helix-turn-helix domain-containing protein [Bacillus licheniformis]MEC1550981.1 helix-turn-helix transcriptional regulator [Bacillus haynesii]